MEAKSYGTGRTVLLATVSSHMQPRPGQLPGKTSIISGELQDGGKVTINVPVVSMARYVRNDFEAGNIHYEGHYKGVGPEIGTFLGPKMATRAASAIWAQKSHPRFSFLYLLLL